MGRRGQRQNIVASIVTSAEQIAMSLRFSSLCHRERWLCTRREAQAGGVGAP